MRVFWDIAPCSLAGVDRRFRRAFCFHHQGDMLHTKTTYLTSLPQQVSCYSFVIPTCCLEGYHFGAQVMMSVASHARTVLM
jgi:hypothetical protein